jgi:hypothetical protein
VGTSLLSKFQKLFKTFVDAHRGGGRWDKSGPFFLEKTQKVYPPKKMFTNPIYPPFQNLAKTSWTLPVDFQTVFIYENNTKLNQLSKFIGPGFSVCLYSSKTDTLTVE